MNSLVLWYAARGTGVAMLVLFTTSLVLGILTRGGAPLPGLPRFAVAALHRNVALMAVVFLVIHVTTIVLDPFSRVGLLAVVVPFVSDFRPIWVGLGTVAFDLFLAIVGTSLLRARIGHRVWKVIHAAAFASWPAAVLHGMWSGTDNTTPWMLAVDVLVIGSVVASVAWRLSSSPRWRRAGDRRVAVAGAR